MKPTLYLMVGLPCSGKTTTAKKLENELNALRLSPDDWEIPLFGNNILIPKQEKRHTLIEKLLWELAVRALKIGTSVILDFGFWSIEERNDFRGLAKELGARSEIIFMDVEKEELLRRLSERNKKNDENAYIPEKLLLEWIDLFQKPLKEELIARE